MVRIAAILSLLLGPATAAFGPASARAAEESTAGPFDTSKWVGANYTPAYAVNQVQMWHDFRPDVVGRELAAAEKHFGITTLRVYLHYIVYRAEKEKFLSNIEKFLVICDRHGIRPGFTFFDDCWNHSGIELEFKPPVDGLHNGRWAAVQDADRKDENLPLFQAYVQDVVRPHLRDRRVLWWEIYNEPKRKDVFTVKLIEGGHRWIKDLNPTQPAICCWDDNPQTDIVNAHNYGDDFAGRWNRQADLNPSKGTVFTEAGARWYAHRPRSNGAPIEVIHWLKSRRAQKKTVPGVYLCWELMVGNSHCRWYWGTKRGAAEPAIPWCGLLWPDCIPVSYAEAEAIRSYTTGQSRALFFDDFQAAPPRQEHPRWTRYEPGGSRGGSRYLELDGSMKMVAGDSGWSDYLLEATVMLQSGEGNAGLVFRVNDPGPGADQMHGYYVGFDEKTLYLGKMENNWQPMETVDLTKRENKVEPNVWNRLRVVVQGDRIRVWFNPIHDQTGSVIDTRDRKNPILRGAFGCRTHRVRAWFDDVVVLPPAVLGE